MLLSISRVAVAHNRTAMNYSAPQSHHSAPSLTAQRSVLCHTRKHRTQISKGLQIYRRVCAHTCGQCALGTHLRQQQQASLLFQTHRSEAINDARPRDHMGISHIRPVSNLVDAPTVLTDHGVADVSKLAVLKYEEVCSMQFGLRLQP